MFHQKETLLYKVFKAKFFPEGCIFDDTVPSKCSSYVWRSILQAREVVQKGTIWRVDDGASIKVWDHKWLLDMSNSKVLSLRGTSPITLVKELLVPNSYRWDMDLLDSTFVPWEAEEKKRIHISGYDQEDAYIWLLTPDGEYSI